jgi:hypothetical protein
MRRCARPIPAAASASAPAPEAVPAPGSAAGVCAGAVDDAREVGISPAGGGEDDGLIAGASAGAEPAAGDSAAPLADAVLAFTAALR